MTLESFAEQYRAKIRRDDADGTDSIPGRLGEQTSVIPMWPGGPSRHWLMTKYAGWFPYATGGYVGSYVCTSCHKSVAGVYSPSWICGTCRKRARR
jgi:hypothetical protein